MKEEKLSIGRDFNIQNLTSSKVNGEPCGGRASQNLLKVHQNRANCSEKQRHFDLIKESRVKFEEKKKVQNRSKLPSLCVDDDPIGGKRRREELAKIKLSLLLLVAFRVHPKSPNLSRNFIREFCVFSSCVREVATKISFFSCFYFPSLVLVSISRPNSSVGSLLLSIR